MLMFKNLKIGVKLISAFLLLSMITGIVGYVGVSNMKKLNDSAEDLYQRELLGVSYIKQANVGIVSIGRGLSNAILASTQDERSQSFENIKKRLPKIQENMDKAEKLFKSEQAKRDFANLQKEWTQYQEDIKQAEVMIAAEKLSENLKSTEYVRHTVREVANSVDDSLNDLVKIKEKDAEDAAISSTQLYNDSRNLMIIFAMSGV